MEKERYYINTKGNDDAAYKEAMKFACEMANKDAAIKRIVLLISTQQNTGWFERIYDRQIVKSLFKGHKFAGCNPVFQFETTKTYKDKGAGSEIVICCGLDDTEIFKVDDFYSPKSIIVIPWLNEKVQKWVKTWAATDLRAAHAEEAVAVAAAYPEPSRIVKKAMEELTDSINMSTGIHHPSDEEDAKTYILALHKYEDELDADVVGAYLVSELGWETKHAAEVEELINKLNNGKHFKGGRRTGLKQVYQVWVDECEN